MSGLVEVYLEDSEQDLTIFYSEDKKLDCIESVVETFGKDLDSPTIGYISSRPVLKKRQSSDVSYESSAIAEESSGLALWRKSSTLGIVFFYTLFILAPLSFAADDLFASFVDGISHSFHVDQKEAQRLAYHWDSISFGFASIGAPLSAILCSFLDPAFVSVAGSLLACGGIGFVLEGFVKGHHNLVLKGLGIRSNGSEIQIQALFPIIKRWTLGLNLKNEGASAVYMERAVAMVNASILLIMAIGPVLSLSHSLTVITQGLSVCFGLCGLSMIILAVVTRPRKQRSIDVMSKRVSIVPSIASKNRIKNFMQSRLNEVKAMLFHLWSHPLALLAILQRNIIFQLQEQTGKGFATVVLPLSTGHLNKENLGRLILIIPGFCTVAVTIFYTLLSHHCISFDRFTKRWNSFLLAGCMLYTCGIWHFLSREDDDRTAIVLIVLIGFGRGLASCLISYPVGLAYDAEAVLIDPSNFMPLVSNILMNCIFSFTPWIMLTITAHSTDNERLHTFRNAPSWGYTAMAGLFLLQGLLLKYSHLIKKFYTRTA